SSVNRPCKTGPCLPSTRSKENNIETLVASDNSFNERLKLCEGIIISNLLSSIVWASTELIDMQINNSILYVNDVIALKCLAII
ncbi:MAG: hypothetical protein ACI9SC_001826, partial [Gammaproteobacteria bacterium]